MSKNYKVVVLNTKGGAGKSTTCAQIIVPYLYKKTGKPITIYEFDDENQGSHVSLGNEIVIPVRIPVGHRDLRDEITEILLNDHVACIDVGANKTASAVINALLDSGMIYRVDLVIIPLMDGEIDAMSALEIYCSLKESHSKLKIIFALSRVNTSRDLKCQFDLFLGDSRGLFQKEGILASLQPEDQCYFLVPDTDAIKYSRLFGSSVWELAQIQKDPDKELREAIQKNADVKTIRSLSFKRSLKHDCELYVENAILPAFEIINKRLEE